MDVFLKNDNLSDRLNADIVAHFGEPFVFQEDYEKLTQQVRDLFANNLTTIDLPEKAIIVIEEHTIEYNYGDSQCTEYRAAVHCPAV